MGGILWVMSVPPIIGICVSLERARWGRAWDDEVALLPRAYLDHIARAGGVPLLLAPGGRATEDPDTVLSRQVPGVDAIVMGHTHTLVPTRTENGVLLTQAGRWGNALGRLDLTFEKTGATWALSEKRANLVLVDKTVPSDPTIEQIAKPYHDRAEAWLKTVLAQASTPLKHGRARARQRAARPHSSHADGKRQGRRLARPMFSTRVSIAPGPITVRDAFAIYPYENTLAVLEVTGKDLKAALEHATGAYNGYDFGKTDAPMVAGSIPGYNFDIAQGVSYTLDLLKPVGQRIENLSWRGRPLADDKKLHVAVSNYRVNGGGGFDMFKGKPIVYRSELPTRDLLMDELKKLDGRQRQGRQLAARARLGFDPAGSRAGLELLVRRGIVLQDSRGGHFGAVDARALRGMAREGVAGFRRARPAEAREGQGHGGQSGRHGRSDARQCDRDRGAPA